MHILICIEFGNLESLPLLTSSLSLPSVRLFVRFITAHIYLIVKVWLSTNLANTGIVWFSLAFALISFFKSEESAASKSNNLVEDFEDGI